MTTKLLDCGCRVEEGSVEDEHLNEGPYRHKPVDGSQTSAQAAQGDEDYRPKRVEKKDFPSSK